jgi:hypothetical protein
VLKIECLPLFQNNVNATLFDSAFLAFGHFSHLFATLLFSVSFFRVHFLGGGDEFDDSWHNRTFFSHYVDKKIKNA